MVSPQPAVTATTPNGAHRVTSLSLAAGQLRAEAATDTDR
jgi:hypothetical protein